MTTTPESSKGVPRIEGNTAPTLRADHNALADWARDKVGEAVASKDQLPADGNWSGRHIWVEEDNCDYVYFNGSWNTPGGAWSSLEPADGYRPDNVSPPYGSRIGDTIYLTGVVLPESGSFPANTLGIFAYKPLPDALRPPRNERVPITGPTGPTTGVALIYTDGRIEFRTAAAASYLSFSGGVYRGR